MKKIFTMMLVAVISIATMVGCGNRESAVESTRDCSSALSEVFFTTAVWDYSNKNYSDIIKKYHALVVINDEQVSDELADNSATSIGKEYIAPHHEELKDYFEKNKDYAIECEVLRKYDENQIEVTEWFPSKLSIEMEDCNREYSISKVMMCCSVNNMPKDRPLTVYSSDIVENGDYNCYSDGLSFAFFGELLSEEKKETTNLISTDEPEEDTSVESVAYIPWRYYGTIADVIDNGDGTYNITFTDCAEACEVHISQTIYDNLSVGCELPFESYMNYNFICYDDSDGYYFSEDGLKSNDWEIFWISDKNKAPDGSIKVFHHNYSLGMGYEEYLDSIDKGTITCTVSGDAWIKIRDNNNDVIKYTFDEFYKNDINSNKKYLDTWRHLYTMEIHFDSSGEIDNMLEVIYAG